MSDVSMTNIILHMASPPMAAQHPMMQSLKFSRPPSQREVARLGAKLCEQIPILSEAHFHLNGVRITKHFGYWVQKMSVR